LALRIKRFVEFEFQRQQKVWIWHFPWKLSMEITEITFLGKGKPWKSTPSPFQPSDDAFRDGRGVEAPAAHSVPMPILTLTCLERAGLVWNILEPKMKEAQLRSEQMMSELQAEWRSWDMIPRAIF
jgi:hypothetical protein